MADSAIFSLPGIKCSFTDSGALFAGLVFMRWKTSLKDRVFDFGQAILRLYPRLCAPGPPYAHMAQQLVKAASSIGAQLEEGDVAGSRRDMGSKHAIALREAKESVYWIRMFMAAGVLVKELGPLCTEGQEFRAMLTASVKKLRLPEDEV